MGKVLVGVGAAVGGVAISVARFFTREGNRKAEISKKREEYRDKEAQHVGQDVLEREYVKLREFTEKKMTVGREDAGNMISETASAALFSGVIGGLVSAIDGVEALPASVIGAGIGPIVAVPAIGVVGYAVECLGGVFSWYSHIGHGE
jgi:hypothetical protein